MEQSRGVRVVFGRGAMVGVMVGRKSRGTTGCYVRIVVGARLDLFS
jgi:hypothetical protein